MKLVGAIEMGGTKCVVAVGSGPGDLRDRVRIETTSPEATLATCVEHLESAQARHGKLDALGVAAFGPLGVHPTRADFGCITTTPKPGWQQTDVLGFLRRKFAVPMGFDTDVNAAALAEATWGAGRGSEAVLYLTVGTGIGGGYFFQGRVLHGLLHPEMGHVRVARHLVEDDFAGCCPWHGDCLEGLASGNAMGKRWARPAAELPRDHPAWDLEAHYLGQACANFICTLSPERIIIGGGVASEWLLEKVRLQTERLLGGYIDHPNVREGMGSYIVPPGLGENAGILGAVALALEAGRIS